MQRQPRKMPKRPREKMCLGLALHASLTPRKASHLRMVIMDRSMMTMIALRKALKRFSRLARPWNSEPHVLDLKQLNNKRGSMRLKTEKVTRCAYTSSSKEI